MSSKSQKLDWFRMGGMTLAVWAFANTYLGISRYGIETGFYWWFCNLALIGMSLGLLFKKKGWIIAFVSIALYTQIFWVLDNLYRLLTGTNLLGMAEFMFQPGLPLDEFLLSHYHYLTIPIAFTALFHLPRKKTNAMKIIASVHPFVFAVSYFVFPKVQNINCVHEPCFPRLEHWAGPTYSVLYGLSIFGMHLLVGSLLEKYFSKGRVLKPKQLRIRQAFGACMFITLVIVLLDFRYKKSLPSFKCEGGEESQGVQIDCGYTLDYAPGIMLFHYRVKNASTKPKVCKTALQVGEQTLLMDNGLELEKKSLVKSQVLVPYPHVSVEGKLRIECESELRGTATE